MGFQQQAMSGILWYLQPTPCLRIRKLHPSHGNLMGKTALIDVMGMFMESMMMNTIALPVWPILRKAGYLANPVEMLN
jgi:hypothetical protein